jgi:membrane fusion protein, copper/silver efflux system
MHPQLQKPGPGPCPICGMDLIPVMSGPAGESDSQREVTLSATARRLAQIETTPVTRRSVAVELRMVGKVQVDETRLATIAPRVDGRIDRLMANYTGMAVQAGDPLADLYSPEWVATQQELLQAMKAEGTSEASSSLLQATRERLRLWGVSPRQIEEIEQRGQVSDHVTFYSPIGGIVVEMAAREGEYVKAGMSLFTIADLSRVWVELDAYESDLGQIRVGQPVIFTAEAVPGKTFSGRVAFIHPVLNPATRTVKVRVDAENADGRLKPEYFVRAVVQASSEQDEAETPLVIPASAPLLTGRRAVVYVQDPDREGTYEGREVVLGPRAGEFYIVRSGLKEGEEVVTRGAFKLDAELQLHAKPSMMNPEGGGGGGMPGMNHGDHPMEPSSHE